MLYKKNVFILFFISFLMIFSTFSWCFPRGCEVTGFGYNGANLVVNEHGAQAYYLIHNFSPLNIELQRLDTTDSFMTPPLTAKIQTNNWAAFASDIKDMHFQCFATENANSRKVDCREVIEICQYPRVKFALSNMGNYWVSVNKDQRQIINDSTTKGIYLHW